MRYPDGGGLTPTARAKREQLRMEAAELFAAGIAPPLVAKRLRVSRKTAYVWHRVWQADGPDALRSKGPGGTKCQLSDKQQSLLQDELDRGPAAHGWIEDQRWTLDRVVSVIWKLFRVSYTPRGVSYLLHRLGWSPQVPQHRSAGRDEEAIATWVRETWPSVERRRGTRTRGSASKTKQANH